MNLLTLFTTQKVFYIPPTLFPRDAVFSFISADELTADQVMWSLCCVTAGMWARAAPHTLTRGAVWSESAHSPLSVRLNWGYSMRNTFALLLICRTVIQPGITSAFYRFLRSILDFRRQKIAGRIPLWQLRLWRALVSSLALWNGWRDAAVTVADAKRLKTVGSQTGKRVWDRTTLIV